MSRAESPEFRIRAAVAADTLGLGVPGTQVFLDTYATGGIRPALAREVLANFSGNAIAAIVADAASRVIVAERKAHLIGFAQLTLGATDALLPPGAATKLNRLYVQGPFTGQGVGRALLQRAEALAARSGATTLWLTACAGNAKALRFYPRHGYVDVGATTYLFEADAYENLVFAKTIDNRSGGAAAGDVGHGRTERTLRAPPRP